MQVSSIVLNSGALPGTARMAPLRLRTHGHPGRLITFCGIDGSGKSTLMKAAAAYLEARGARITQTFTPTARMRGNPLFRELVDASSELARRRVNVLGLCLQVLGDLLQHVADAIEPRLVAGEVVLCDRYIFSSLGEIRARSTDMAAERVLAHVAESVLRPDLAIAVHAPAWLAMERVRQRPDERHLVFDPAFVARQASCYRAAAIDNDLPIVRTDVGLEASLEAVYRQIDACIGGRMP